MIKTVGDKRKTVDNRNCHFAPVHKLTLRSSHNDEKVIRWTANKNDSACAKIYLIISRHKAGTRSPNLIHANILSAILQVYTAFSNIAFYLGEKVPTGRMRGFRHVETWYSDVNESSLGDLFTTVEMTLRFRQIATSHLHTTKPSLIAMTQKEGRS